MALAFIELDGIDGGAVHFRIDIGTNRYYSYAVGNGERPVSVEGFKVLGERSYESPLAGPLPPSALGRAVLDIPMERFQRDNEHVQLVSFRTQQLGGPAVSDLVHVPRGGAYFGNGLPPITFSAAPPPLETVPVWHERAPVSTAMFLDALAGIVSKVAPMIGPILGNLFGGAGGTGGAAGGIGPLLGSLLGGGGAAGGASAGPPPALGAVIQKAATPENLKLIADLLQSLLGDGAKQNGTPPAKPDGTQQASQSSAFATDARYSQAFIAPAVLAALPALMPLLQQVLTPETVKTLIQTADPTKVLGMVSQGIQELAKLGLQGQKQEMEHLEKLNPGTATPDLIQLLEGMGLSTSMATQLPRNAATPKLAFARVEAVRLHFADLVLQPLAGRPTAAFRNDRQLAFPLTVETPRPVGRATLQLEVKEPRSLRCLFRRSFPVEEVTTGRISAMPIVPVDQAARLRPGADYLVCASLVWRGKGNRRVGTSITQLITIVGELAFDRIEQSTELVPLNDVERYREFWHKAWQGSFDRERRKVVFNCKYEYALDPKRQANAQMETVTDTEQATVSHEVGRLRSGLVLSLYRLSDLTAQLGAGPPLGPTEIEALKTPEFAARFSQAARTQVSFRGRPGDSAALWVFPEVKVQQVVLRGAEEVNEAGHVVRFAERRVPFAMPALIHVIGVATQ
jgi:hypothetical protein